MASSSTPASLLPTLLTERALRLMAGAASFERGERYATTRRVKKLKVTESELSATVTGTRSYQVRIWAEEGSLSYSCSCPMGDDEVFCKHCVAIGLVWLGAVATKEGAPRPGTAGHSEVDVRAYLLSRDKEALVELLMERAATDELFDAKLALEAAKASSLHADLEPYRQAIEAAIVVDDFVDYRSMYDYSCNVQAAIGAIEELLENEQAADVIDLCEYALECVEDATGRVDDSDGQMGEIREQLVELHHRACLEARPSSEELAERLFDWAIHSDWETLIDGAERYADVLGEAGLARYRALAEKVWDHVPELANANREDYTGSRFRITYIMEALAKLSGSVEEQVAVKARDLTYAYHYVQIVELLAEAGRFEEALEWAERGLGAFPDRTDVRLRDIAARELHRVGRDIDAISLIWTEFEERPNFPSYELLHRHAAAAGTWAEHREEALKLMRGLEGLARSAGTSATGGHVLSRPAAWRAPRGYDEHPESSELVRVLLWENDAEAAWAQDNTGGCSTSLWMQLAALREKEHPADTIPIYQDEVEREIAGKTNRDYETAVATMRKVRALMGKVGRGDEFPGYAAHVRALHKAKRNLMKLFDNEGW